MSRRKKLLLNTVTGVFKQLITVICGFILPRYFLLYYGSSVNGLVSSITFYLSFIALLDMGVGAVVQANLYKPLAEKNNDEISRIIMSSERFFCKLAYIFIGYIILLCVFFPLMVDYGRWYTISLLIIISISNLIQYLFGMTYQLLLNSDQKAYVQLGLQIGTVLLNTVLAITLIRLGASIHVVKLMTTMVYVIRPIGQMVYVHRHYDINKRIELVGEPIKQKWNGFSQHFAAVICQNIDVAVLTLFSAIENVSIYSVYYNVTYGVEQIIMTAATGVESLFGNMIANGENKKLSEVFGAIEWLTHFGVTVVFTISAIMIVPFVAVYTRGITDANYITPIFGVLLVTAYGFQCLRIPYFRIIKAAGHFKETQNGAYISAVLNIVVTVLLVFNYGLNGAALGTLIAMIYHTCYFVWYLKKNIINRPIKYFVTYIIVDTFVAIISFFLTKGFVTVCNTYIEWMLISVKVMLIVFSVSAIINIIIFKDNIKRLFRLIKR